MNNNFLNNLRSAIVGNNLQTVGKLPERRDFVMRNRENARLNAKIAREVQKEYDEANAQVAPLKEEIRESSNGRINVDKTIYNREQLERILSAVNEMKNFNGGVLFPGDTDMSNAYFAGNTLGLYLQHGDSNDTRGRDLILLDNANNVGRNDEIAKTDVEYGWHPRSGDKNESSTHVHEMAHAAHKNALRKTTDPSLTLNYAEKAKRQNFRDTHPALQQIFETAAKKLGYNTVLEAAESISGYAASDVWNEYENKTRNRETDWRPNFRLPEVFAEAYTDVLYNKEKASPYSQELLKQYVDYMNDYNKTFTNGITQEMGILPTKDSNFINKWRELYFGKKK